MPTDTGLIPTLRHTHSPNDGRIVLSNGQVRLTVALCQLTQPSKSGTHFSQTLVYDTVLSVRALQLVSSPFKAAVSDHDYCLPTPIEDSTATPYHSQGPGQTHVPPDHCANPPSSHPTCPLKKGHTRRQGRRNAAEKPTRPHTRGTASKESGLHHQPGPH
jgi:hypothetical protein